MSISNSQQIFRTRTNESLRKCKQSKFTKLEDDIIKRMVKEYDSLGEKIRWSEIANMLTNKTGSDVSHRWNSVLNPILIKGNWTPEEDLTIIRWAKQHGPAKWTLLQNTHLPHRCGKQIRERWVNILFPSIQTRGVDEVENMLKKDDNDNEYEYHIKKRKESISSSQPIGNSQWTKDEDELIYELYNSIGPKWKQISSLLKGRSENSVKNRWHSIKNQHFRILEGKDPIMKRGPKRKSLNNDMTIDRSLLMMKNNEDKFSTLPDTENDIHINFFDDIDLHCKENASSFKDYFLLSPTSILSTPIQKMISNSPSPIMQLPTPETLSPNFPISIISPPTPNMVSPNSPTSLMSPPKISILPNPINMTLLENDLIIPPF